MLASFPAFEHAGQKCTGVAGAEASTTHLNEGLFTCNGTPDTSIDKWRIDYNLNRPHTSLDALEPNEFATRSRSNNNVNRLERFSTVLNRVGIPAGRDF
ncbi:transposase [Aminobacter sp. J44]|uniref:transposase n=1 Tax=Aminobacter sp. J44 TaxID=935262 RepID=UPI00119B2653|nr:transposase [Aminobacter sp. J44]TWG53515.1 hypothetical protein L610_005000000010 [Aminobacter sp. J44]